MAQKMLTNYTEVKNKSGHESLNTRDAAMIALCAAVMAVCSWISIPAAVPFTMQTFGVFLAVGLLGGRNGTLAVLIYILLGAAGLPVFSGFTGGIGHLFGATGGYIIGFIFSGLLMWLVEALLGRSMKTLIASMIAGLLVCYAFGTAWFMLVYARSSGAIALATALGWCVLPFIVPDLIKMGLAVLLSERLRKYLH